MDRKPLTSGPLTFVELSQLVKMGVDFEYVSSSVVPAEISVMEEEDVDEVLPRGFYCAE